MLRAAIRHVYNTYTRTPNSTTDGRLNKSFLHSRLDLKARMRIIGTSALYGSHMTLPDDMGWYFLLPKYVYSSSVLQFICHKTNRTVQHSLFRYFPILLKLRFSNSREKPSVLNINTKFISSLRDGTQFPYYRFIERSFCKEPTKTCRLADILPAYELGRLQTEPTAGCVLQVLPFALKHKTQI